jgi:hypothetical protein
LLPLVGIIGSVLFLLIQPSLTYLYIALGVIALSITATVLSVVVRNLPGYDTSWLAPDATTGRVSPTAQSALAAATNALLARGYVALLPADNDQPTLPPGAASATQAQAERPATSQASATLGVPAPVLALVGACAFSPFTLVLALRSATGPVVVFAHAYQGLGVLHAPTPVGLHQFVAVGSPANLRADVETALGLADQPERPFPPQTLERDATLRAREEALAGRPANAERQLIGLGLAHETAHALAWAWGEGVSGLLTFASRATPTHPEQHHTRMVVVAPGACFHLMDARMPGGTTGLRIQSEGASELRKWLHEQLPPE